MKKSVLSSKPNFIASIPRRLSSATRVNTIPTSSKIVRTARYPGIRTLLHRVSRRGPHGLSSPVLRGRTYLYRAAESGRGNARGDLDRRLQISGFEHAVTADRAAGIDVRAVGDLRAAIAYAHGLRVPRQ